MGVKAKKAMTKKLKKASAQFSAPKEKTLDFLPLEGGPARDLPKTEDRDNKATVLYIGRIPHGFYEDEMEAFFKQFGSIKRLRIARNRKEDYERLYWKVLAHNRDVNLFSIDYRERQMKTGKSKHFGFIEFESPEVAKVVEECMHNYLMYEHLLQVRSVPSERVHPKLWKGVTRRYKPLDRVQIERKHHDKERTLEQQQKLVEGIVKRDQKRRKRIEDAGIDYQCPEIVGCIQVAPKKIRFDTE